MDYSCYRDIPMRLDIRYQPLNFEIYLNQVIVPRTSADEQPYSFQLELDALDRVDQILQRTQAERELLKPSLDVEQPKQIPSLTPEPITTITQVSPPTDLKEPGDQPETKRVVSTDLDASPPPSCPAETLLTPIKSSVVPTSSTSCNKSEAGSRDRSTRNQMNLMEFEEIHYDPFDNLELQSIDERRELDLVFQASYATKNQAHSANLDESAIPSGHNTVTKSV